MSTAKPHGMPESGAPEKYPEPREAGTRGPWPTGGNFLGSIMGVKFQSRVQESTTDGITTTIVWSGTVEEMLQKQNEVLINGYTDNGQLKSSRVTQVSPKIWNCEQKFLLAADGELSEPPDTSYGKKSAQLKGSMLSMPLETLKNYLACWNYYLAAAPGVSDVPKWWETAKDTVLGLKDSQSYVWIKTPGELPTGPKGRWRILKNPKKPGVETYDLATYSVTESARFRSASAAGKMVANTLNKIGRPSNDFNINGGDWKCDDASVSYTGSYWLATLTWTLSGNDEGWDKDLYK